VLLTPQHGVPETWATIFLLVLSQFGSIELDSPQVNDHVLKKKKKTSPGNIWKEIKQLACKWEVIGMLIKVDFTSPNINLLFFSTVSGRGKEFIL